jgi:septum formation protein
MTYPQLKQLTDKYPLILGSASPRRARLLEETGVPFSIVKPNLEEERLPDESPYDYAVRLARDKALAVARRTSDNSIILGCDTIVVLGDRVLEKPADKNEAFAILDELRGKWHVVCSAIAICHNGRIVQSEYELTRVHFNPVTDKQVWEYIESGEPMDKAGAYGIQGIGGFLVDTFEGSLDTVIGFPRTLLERMAGEILQSLRLGN